MPIATAARSCTTPFSHPGGCVRRGPRRLLLALSTLILLGASALPAFAQQTLTGQHSTVTYTGQLGIATTLRDTVDQVWGPMTAFFAPLGLTDLSPIEVELTDDTPNGAPGYTGTFGAHKIQVHESSPVTINGQPSYRTTLVHEMFHVFAYRAGVVRLTDLMGAQNHWLIEGTAEMAEHLFLPPPHKITRFQNYLYSTSRHGVSLLDADHYSSFFIYYLWHELGQSNVVFDLMSQFAATHDGAAVAQQMGLAQHWRDFTERMWNETPAQQILVDGAPVSATSGQPIQPNFQEAGARHTVPASGTVPVNVDLPPLSWRHFLFEVPASNVFASFYMGGLAQEASFIAHAYVRDAASGAWSYEDWTGQPYRRFCLQQVEVCANENLENIDRVALILANEDPLATLSDAVAAGTLASRWRLKEVQVSASKIVPAVGELTMEFGTGGGLLVSTHGFWLKFPESDFQGESQLAYDYINEACRMKGFVKFRRDDEKAEYEPDEERDRFSWQTTRVEKGGLINTPSGWWCGFSAETGGLSAAGLAVGGSVAAIFTRLNTREYPSGSFAANLSAVMKAVLSLQVPEGSAKEVVMYQKTTGGDVLLQVELQGNVRAFFEPIG